MPFSNCGRMYPRLQSLHGFEKHATETKKYRTPGRDGGKDGLYDVTVRTGLKINDAVRIGDASIYRKYRNIVSISINRIVSYRPPQCRFFRHIV